MRGSRGFFPNTTGVMWRGWELNYLGAFNEYPWEAYNRDTGEILYAGTHRGIRAVIKNANRINH